MTTLLIVDGHNAAFRLIQMLPVLRTNGQPIQIVYGFLRLLRSVLEQFNPDIALVCWDSGHSAARKKIFPLYKANRGQNPEYEKERSMLQSQVGTLKQVLRMVNVAQLTYPDTEADDLIGIACLHLPEMQKIIVSSDRDMFQLIDAHTQVWSPIKLELFTHRNFKEKLGLSPTQYLEMRALTGDTSDNIPGVAKGFGEVSAKELLLKYGSIEKILCPGTEKKMLSQGGRQALLCAEGVRETAYRNLHLMDLRMVAAQSHPDIHKLLNTTLRRRRKIEKVELLTYFKKNEFASLLKDLVSWLQPFENLSYE